MDFFYIVLGLVLLFAGGELLIKGSVTVSRKLGISPVLIGVAIVGFGTSTPELLVSVQASLAGVPEIAMGNIVGSNTANIMLILAVSAIIAPICCDGGAIRREALFSLFGGVCLLGLSFLGEVGRMAGGAMIVMLAAYLWYSYRQDQTANAATEQDDTAGNFWLALGMAVGGIVILVFGARFLVGGATAIARGYGVSEAVIGLSLVAVGTSLPELTACVIGTLRKQTDMVIGNILGSNMFNILGILGIASVIKPMPISAQMAAVDIPIMLGAMALCTGVVFAFRRFNRAIGVVMLGLYAAYMWWLFQAGAV